MRLDAATNTPYTVKKKKKPMRELKPPIMPGTPGTQGRGGASLFVESEDQRADRYPTIPYSLPRTQKRRDYGMDLANLGVRFENPNGMPVPEGFQEHVYNAIMRSPAFSSYVRNVGSPRWSDPARGRRGKGGGQRRDPRGHIIIHLGTDVTSWSRITVGNASNLAPSEVGGLYNAHDIHVRIPPEVLLSQTAKKRRGPRDVRPGSLDFGWLDNAYGEEVLLHEIGHHVDAQLKLSRREDYQAIANDPKVVKNINDWNAYGNMSLQENFATSYQRYVQSPDTRASMDPRVRSFFDRYVDPLLPHRPDLPRTRDAMGAAAKQSAERIHKLLYVADFGHRNGFTEKTLANLLDNYDEVYAKLKKAKQRLRQVK